MTKPFLKWVGGKRQLLPDIRPLIPELSGRYFEPFMGGAAVFFDIAPQQAYLRDINEELVNCYCQVRDHADELLADLKRHIYDKDYYYEVRNLDRYEDAYAKLSDIERASRLIFLNRTGFNGMYRVNRKGQFNIPFGRYANPTIANETLIREASAALQQADIRCQPYLTLLSEAKAGDFIYFDPPYLPVSKTANFTAYAADDFTLSDQEELAGLCRMLDQKQVKFLLSNTYHEVITSLYEGFDFIKIEARRAINSKADKRQAVPEILIKNY